MKPEWELKTLGNVLATIRNGVNCQQTKGDDGDRISRIESISDGTFNVNKTGRAVLSEKERTQFKLEKGDVLFSHINSPPHVGKTAVFDSNEVVYHGVNLLLFRPELSVSGPFLEHYLKYLHKTGYWRARCKQSVNQASVNQTDIKVVTFPVPPLEEQQRIVAILDEAFEGLDRARANAEANLQNAQELFESILQEATLRDVSKYGVIAISELASEVTDGDHMPPPKAESGIPFITISNIRRDTKTIDFSSTFMVPENYFNALKSKRRPQAGDLLYTVTGATLGIPVLVEDNRPFCFQRHIGLVRPKLEVWSEWLYFMLMSPYVFCQATDGATGTAQKTVSLKVLRSVHVPNCPSSSQKSLSELLRNAWNLSIDAQNKYQEKLQDLDDLRQSLLQKAFAGELT